MRPRLSFHRPLLAGLALVGLAGCGAVSDVVAPGRSGLAPGRLALATRLPALADGGVVSLRVASAYERTDASLQPLGSQTLPLTDARSQDVPVAIDLGPCLSDPLHRGATGTGASCAVRMTVTLLVDGRVVDEQGVGPMVLQPGATTPSPAPLTLYELRTLRIDLPTGATPRPDGTLRLEVGATASLAATALDAAGQPVASRTAAWTSGTPGVATVGAATGIVTGVAVGRARISAAVGGRESAVDVVVVPRPQPVTVTAAGTGSGTVRSAPAGIDCRVTAGAAAGTGCTASFPGDGQVTLTAAADAGSGFIGWSDACAAAGTATTCTIPTDQARAVRASFGVLRRVAVSAAGDGSGTVGSAPAGIACTLGANAGGTCAASFVEGSTVTLSAAASAPDAFVGWGGDCGGTSAATCTLTIGAADRAVSVRFARPLALSVDVAGTGDGAVAGAGISCVRRQGATSGSCTTTASFGSGIALSASADANSTFAGWSGACSGTGACSVTLDQARTVGATFTRRQVTLTVAVGGAGAGSISVDGQRCSLAAGQGSQSCALRVDVGRALSLSAEPATGSEFGGWSGGCAASGRSPGCTLTLTGDGSVGGAFVPGAVRVTVTGSGNTTGGGIVGTGDGRLACSIVGASASGLCEALVPIGTTLSLGAAPDPQSTFGGWSGACAGTVGPSCALTVRAATSVGAQFLRQQVSLAVSVGGSGSGTVSLNGAPFCTLGPTQGSTSCARLVDAGANVTLTLQPSAGVSAIWGGPCSAVPVTSPCTFVATGTTIGVPVSFTLIGTVSVRPVAGYTGGGRIQSRDQRIDCTVAPVTGATSGTCDAVYLTGTSVTLDLTSFTMARFVGAWSGLCTSSTTSCTFTVPATGGAARITLPEFVNLSVGWTGSGTVATVFSDSTAQLQLCSAVPGNFGCTGTAPEGSTATFTATSQVAGGFEGWTDACAAAGTAPVCTRTVPFRTSGSTSLTVAARFDFSVLLGVNGGAGTVTLQNPPAGAPATCTSSGVTETLCTLRSTTPGVTLVATPAPGYVFAGWDAFGCSTSTTCNVDAQSNGRIYASFVAQGPVGLSFDRDPAGGGTGRVITSFGTCNLPLSGPNGACNEVAQVGSTRTYTAQATLGSAFVAWGGPCAGQTGTTCTLSPVTVGGTITLRFDQTPTQQLTVTGINSVTPGTGTVTSTPGGIACTMTGSSTSGTCVGQFGLGSNVSLTPTPATGSVFSAWSGACTGSTVPCVVPMTGTQAVGALFVPATVTLVLAFDAEAVQRIFLSSNVGASCSATPEFGISGNACAPTGTSVPNGTSVTVTGSGQNPGSAFVGWTGGPCAGLRAATCTFTITGPTTVVGRTGGQVNPTISIDNTFGSTQANVTVATFRSSPTFSASPNGNAFTSATVFTGDQVTFTASTTAPNVFISWSEGPCQAFASNPVCTLIIDGSEGVIGASFGETALRAPASAARRRRPPGQPVPVTPARP